MNPLRTVAARVVALLVTVTAIVFSAPEGESAGRREPSGIISCIAPPSGLIAWMPGDGNAQDIQNNIYDLSATGVTFPAGKVAQAVQFDGTGSASYATINAGTSFTVDLWVRPTRSIGYEHLVSYRWDDSSGKFGALYFVNDHIEYWRGGSGAVGSASGSVPQNTNSHVALSYDGQFYRLYVNGTLVGTSGSITSDSLNTPVALGYSVVPSDNHFAGQLDEVDFFNRALSASEIQGIFAADSAGKCKTLVDADGDGVVDSRDACPGTPSGTTVNASGCPANACFPPPANLNNWFAGDGSLQDIRSNADIERVRGAFTFPSGQVAQAINFDGTNDVTYATINAGTSYTLDLWVRPTRAVSYEHLVSNDWASNAGTYGALYFVNDHIEYLQGGSGRVSSAPGSVPLNSYAHIALIHDGQVTRLYVNGNLTGTSGVYTEIFNNRVRLGYAVSPSDSRFAGRLDEVEIFTRALSQTEVRGIFHAGASGKCKMLVDADGDGVVDNLDACPNTPPEISVNASGCPAGACFAPPPGMINWFAGDGNANDRISANNGTINGGVSFPAGRVAQTFSFDGTGDVTYATINAGTTYTLDFWLRPARAFDYEHLFSNADGPPEFGQLYFHDNHIEYWQGGGFRLGTETDSVPLNLYTHVALSYDGDRNRLYLNGNLEATSASHGSETFNNAVRLAYATVAGQNRFAGEIDEVEIFNRALSHTEIRGIFDAAAAGKCKNGAPILALRITSIVRLTNGHVVLQGTGQPDTTFEFQRSLTTPGVGRFSFLGTVSINGAGNWQSTDTTATAASRAFYRATLP